MPTLCVKWPFFASGYPSSAAKAGKALSDLLSPAHFSELDGAARWTSNTEEGDRDFAIPPPGRKCPT